jgi:hypothetical protein
VSKQLWSDDEIDAELITIGYSRADRIMRAMRDEYEAELAAANERIAALEASQEPSWDKAPEWAQWWAMDADGSCHWYSQEPAAKQFSGVWATDNPKAFAGRRLPLWAEIKRRRPQEAQRPSE